jgi:hypothetical protein
VAKYKLTENHLDTKHGIAKLQRDGFTREQISKSMYSIAGKISADEARKLTKKLYDRTGEC